MSVGKLLAFVRATFHRHRFVLGGGFCVVALCAFVLLVPHTVLARDIDIAAKGSTAVDQLVNFIASFFNWIATAIGQLILVLIGMILIPILNYDGFSTSYIVGLGWALTRDIVNMFVVIVLLVISVLTIVGSPRANWQQQIPRLFIYVIAVNFSRTICGFLIDIGNVIMFQFVNALTEIGAGNFAQLLKLDATGDYSDGIDTIHSWQNLGASWLQVALMAMVLGVVGILVIVMLYRIVILWVLVILSPAAFFLGGIKDVFSQAGSAYSDWWKKFSSAIILGPLLTFFLWLALAVAASGDIVTKENFPVGETDNVSGLVLKAFDISQLTGLLLGLVLLVVGMQLASSAAGALGGLAEQFVNKGTGKSLMMASLKWPVSAARVPKKGVDLSAKIAPQTTAMLGAGVAVAGAKIGKVPGFGLAGRAVSGAGIYAYKQGEHKQEENMKKAREGLAKAPASYKKALYGSMLKDEGGVKGYAKSTFKGANAFHSLSADQQQVMFEDLATKVKEQKAAAAALSPEQHDDLMKRVITKTQHDIDGGHSSFDDTQKTAFKATKSQFLDLTFTALGDDKGAAFVEEQDSGFDPRVVRARALNGDAGTDSMEKIRTSMNRRIVKTENNEDITALHEAERGTYGASMKKATESGSRRVVASRRYQNSGPNDFGVDGKDPRNRRANVATPPPPPPVAVAPTPPPPIAPSPAPGAATPGAAAPVPGAASPAAGTPTPAPAAAPTTPAAVAIGSRITVANAAGIQSTQTIRTASPYLGRSVGDVVNTSNGPSTIVSIA